MSKTVIAFFTDSGAPSTGLSPVIKVWNVSDNNLDVNEEAMSEVGDGFYSFSFGDYNQDKDYAIRCDGGSSLSDSDRYTFGGNESYVEDIWGAKTGLHNTAGSFGDAVISSGGAIMGDGGKSRPLTKEEMEEIAEKVWEVILDNKQKAKEVLLSRSDFDATRDEVMVKNQINIQELENIVKLGLEEIKNSLPAEPTDNFDTEKILIAINGINQALISIQARVGNIKDVTPEIRSSFDGVKNSLSKLKLEFNEKMSEDDVEEIKQLIKATNENINKFIKTWKNIQLMNLKKKIK